MYDNFTSEELMKIENDPNLTEDEKEDRKNKTLFLLGYVTAPNDPWEAIVAVVNEADKLKEDDTIYDDVIHVDI